MQEFAREVSLRRERLPPEPASSVDPATVVLISLRLPSGERLDRRFHISDQLQVMAYTPASGNYIHQLQVMHNTPATGNA